LYLACIFDLDGTLANTLESIAYFSNRALEECGYPTIPVQDYKTIVGDGADMQVRRMMDSAAGSGAWTEEDFRRVRTVYGDLYASNPTYLLKNYVGMPQTIRRLKDAGLRTAVLSNKPHEWVTAIIAHLFPEGSFDVCLGQTPGIPRKPAPDGALLVADKLGMEPAQCLYVGDTNTDMKTGAAAGMDTAGAVWGFRTREELERNGARYLAEKPERIAEIALGADDAR
jgi:phosphoglycolate phosphatase